MAQEDVSVHICNPLLPLCACVCVLQRQGKVQETQLKCTKARNDYLLNLAAANAAMKKYYLKDICTLIDVSAMIMPVCSLHSVLLENMFWFPILK